MAAKVASLSATHEKVNFLSQKSVAKRIFQDPFSHMCLLIGSSFAFFSFSSYSIKAIVLAHSGVVGITMVCLALLAHYFRHQIVRSFCMAQVVFSHAVSRSPWWNEIVSGVLLGGIPLKNKGHFQQLVQQEKIAAVLTILEEVELADQAFAEPVKATDWQEAKIEQRRFSAPNFYVSSIGQLGEMADFIHGCQQAEKKLYVHCQAGQGRSATAFVCYLLKYQRDYTVDSAIKFVASKRKIQINSRQRAMIKEFVKTF